MLIDFTSPRLALSRWFPSLVHPHSFGPSQLDHLPPPSSPCTMQRPKKQVRNYRLVDSKSARDEMHHFAIAIAYFSLLRPPILAAIHAPVQLFRPSSTNLAFPSRGATALASTTRLSRMTKRCRPVYHLLRALLPSNANLDFSTTNLPMRKLTFTYP